MRRRPDPWSGTPAWRADTPTASKNVKIPAPLDLPGDVSGGSSAAWGRSTRYSAPVRDLEPRSPAEVSTVLSNMALALRTGGAGGVNRRAAKVALRAAQRLADGDWEDRPAPGRRGVRTEQRLRPTPRLTRRETFRDDSSSRSSGSDSDDSATREVMNRASPRVPRLMASLPPDPLSSDEEEENSQERWHAARRMKSISPERFSPRVSDTNSASSRDVDWAMSKLAQGRRRKAEDLAAAARMAVADVEADLANIKEQRAREQASLNSEVERSLQAKAQADKVRTELERSQEEQVLIAKRAEEEAERIQAAKIELERIADQKRIAETDLDRLRDEIVLARERLRKVTNEIKTNVEAAHAAERRSESQERRLTAVLDATARATAQHEEAKAAASSAREALTAEEHRVTRSRIDADATIAAARQEAAEEVVRITKDTAEEKAAILRSAADAERELAKEAANLRERLRAETTAEIEALKARKSRYESDAADAEARRDVALAMAKEAEAAAAQQKLLLAEAKARSESAAREAEDSRAELDKLQAQLELARQELEASRREASAALKDAALEVDKASEQAKQQISDIKADVAAAKQSAATQEAALRASIAQTSARLEDIEATELDVKQRLDAQKHILEQLSTQVAAEHQKLQDERLAVLQRRSTSVDEETMVTPAEIQAERARQVLEARSSPSPVPGSKRQSRSPAPQERSVMSSPSPTRSPSPSRRHSLEEGVASPEEHHHQSVMQEVLDVAPDVAILLDTIPKTSMTAEDEALAVQHLNGVHLAVAHCLFFVFAEPSGVAQHELPTMTKTVFRRFAREARLMKGSGDASSPRTPDSTTSGRRFSFASSGQFRGLLTPSDIDELFLLALRGAQSSALAKSPQRTDSPSGQSRSGPRPRATDRMDYHAFCRVLPLIANRTFFVTEQHKRPTSGRFSGRLVDLAAVGTSTMDELDWPGDSFSDTDASAPGGPSPSRDLSDSPSGEQPIVLLFTEHVLPLAARQGRQLASLRQQRHGHYMDLSMETAACSETSVAALIDVNKSALSTLFQYYAKGGHTIARTAAGRQSTQSGVSAKLSMNFLELVTWAKDFAVLPNLVTRLELNDLCWLAIRNAGSQVTDAVDLLDKKAFCAVLVRIAVRLRIADDDVKLAAPTDGSSSSAAARRLGRKDSRRSMSSAASVGSGGGDAVSSKPPVEQLAKFLKWLNESPGFPAMRSKPRHVASMIRPFVTSLDRIRIAKPVATGLGVVLAGAKFKARLQRRRTLAAVASKPL